MKKPAGYHFLLRPRTAADSSWYAAVNEPTGEEGWCRAGFDVKESCPVHWIPQFKADSFLIKPKDFFL